SYGPLKEWLKITKNSQAKSRIKQFVKKQRIEENVLKDIEDVEREIRSMNIHHNEVMNQELHQPLYDKFSFVNEEDLYAAVGYHGITADLVATRLTDNIRQEREKEENINNILSEVNTEKPQRKTLKKDSGVIVEGVDNLLVRLAKCCNPVP